MINSDFKKGNTMVNTEYQEGLMELRLKVGERNELLKSVMARIGDFFSDSRPDTKLRLLEAYCDIREVLGMGEYWGDEG